jgi:DNA-binding transcriptional LysR family regulator
VNLNNIDLNKIVTFCQVVDSGSYRAASEVLNLTPSALSQAISGLEHQLQMPLFHRIGRRMVITENGRSLYREFKSRHSEFMGALHRLVQRDVELSGRLRVGAYLEFAKSQLAPLSNTFLKMHPNAEIKFTFDTPSRLHRLLEERKLDLCFSIFPSAEHNTIQSKRVYQEELVMIGPKGMLSATPSYEEINKAPVVEYYLNHQPTRRWVYLHFKKRPRALPIRAYASTAEMVLALVRQGLGIGVVPEYLLRSELGGENLAVIRPTSERLIDHIWMLQAKDSAASGLQAAFAQQVLESVRL